MRYHDDGLMTALLRNQASDLAARSAIKVIEGLIEDDQLRISTEDLGEQGFLPFATAAGVPGFAQLFFAK